MKTQLSCYLCGKPATTWDHIPPKSLFPKSYQGKGYKLPACQNCNNQTSKDDEYLRDCLAITGQNSDARTVFTETVRRGYMRDYEASRGFPKHKRILADTFDVGMRMPDGDLLKRVLAMKMNAARLSGSFEKVIRGLYYQSFDRQIPSGYSFTVYYQPPTILTELIEKARAKNALKAGMFGDTFSYMGTVTGEDQFVGIWWLSFYQTHGVIVVVDSPERLIMGGRDEH